MFLFKKCDLAIHKWTHQKAYDIAGELKHTHIKLKNFYWIFNNDVVIKKWCRQ